MRILSNFDTNLAERLAQEYTELFGEDRVALIHRSKIFFYRHIGLPIMAFLVLMILVAYGVYMYGEGETIIEIAFWIIAVGGLFAICLSLLNKYVDYKMDFLIVTPKEVIKYDQTGVFSRYIEKIHADKIKSITITKSGIMNSLFDIGTLVFLAEGDKEEGDIVMPYVDSIESTEKKLVHILGLDTIS